MVLVPILALVLILVLVPILVLALILVPVLMRVQVPRLFKIRIQKHLIDSHGKSFMKFSLLVGFFLVIIIMAGKMVFSLEVVKNHLQ